MNAPHLKRVAARSSRAEPEGSPCVRTPLSLRLLEGEAKEQGLSMPDGSARHRMLVQSSHSTAPMAAIMIICLGSAALAATNVLRSRQDASSTSDLDTMGCTDKEQLRAGWTGKTSMGSR